MTDTTDKRPPMSDLSASPRNATKVYMSFDRCPRHGFASLHIMELDAEGDGTGTRLLGPKSCCFERREQWRSAPLTAAKLREIADELTEYAERAHV